MTSSYFSLAATGLLSKPYLVFTILGNFNSSMGFSLSISTALLFFTAHRQTTPQYCFFSASVRSCVLFTDPHFLLLPNKPVPSYHSDFWLFSLFSTGSGSLSFPFQLIFLFFKLFKACFDFFFVITYSFDLLKLDQSVLAG